MKYKWIRRSVSPNELSQLLGVKVNSIKSGLIETGETYVEYNNDGTTSTLPVLAEGVEVDFEVPPTGAEIDRVYNLLIGYKELFTTNTQPVAPLSQDTIRAKELLAMSPPVISMPEIWELLRIFGRKLKY